jgi:hypothetical protein
MIVTGLEPATSRPVILRSTIDLHDRPVHFGSFHFMYYFINLFFLKLCRCMLFYHLNTSKEKSTFILNEK